MPERPEVIKMRENAHDRQYVLENVSKEGGLLDYAGEEMKDDREIALAAIHNNPEALEYVSDRLKADREIVYDSVSEVGWTTRSSTPRPRFSRAGRRAAKRRP